MNKKLIALGAIVMLFAAGTGVYLLFNGDGDMKGKQYYEYDTTKGWYSWNPDAFNITSAYVSVTPYLVNVVEEMYENVYGGLPSYQGVSIDDIPDDYLAYESLVSHNGDGDLLVTSTLREDSTSNVHVTRQIAFTENSTAMISSSAYVVTLYYLLCEKYRCTPFGPDDSLARNELWSIVIGGDSSVYPGITTNYGIETPDNHITLPSTYQLINNIEAYTNVVGNVTSNGTNLVFFAGLTADSADAMSQFYNVFESNGNAHAVFFFSNGISDVLAAIEVIGAVFGMEDQAHDVIDDMRLKFYALHESASQKTNQNGYNYTVYMESVSGKAAGIGTITNDLFELLCWVNINTSDQWQMVSEEVIVEKQPEVIIFYTTDARSMDEKMRVNV